MICKYHGCEEPAHGPPPTDKSWHLCKGHQDQITEIFQRKPFNPKAVIGFWARGTDKEKFVKEMTDSTLKFLRRLQGIRTR